ncbi:MAG: enoyl-CoA hydratase/isomerase family protein [candidate division NC10 bacterium]|nr:enoyl-CoA hydratase/isomerase family protein [candidate division NC10 bacterium]
MLAVEDGIATITLNRPERLNALNRALVEELDQALDQVERNEAVKVAVITGAGEKAFAAGADINEFTGLKGVEALKHMEKIQRVFLKIERLSKSVVAAVNGYALGGGCELMMACDIAYASETARFGQPEINLGIIPGAGGTQRLPRLVGKMRAKELILTGDMIDAAEAYRIGLVNKVVPSGELMNEVKKLCEKLLSKWAVALKLAKAAIEEGSNAPLQEGMGIEAKAEAICFSTEDKEEGVAAFLEKRKPVFTGR